MKIEFQEERPGSASLLDLQSDCLVVGIYEAKDGLTVPGKCVDEACGGLISRLIRSGDASAKAGETLMLHAPQGLSVPRLLLVGLGCKEKLDYRIYADAARSAARCLASSKAVSAVWALTAIDHDTLALSDQVAASVRGLREAHYRFDAYKQRADASVDTGEVKLYLSATADSEVKRRMAEALATANGVSLAKDLGNTPPNVCTPAYLAGIGMALGNDGPLKVEVLEQPRIEALGMGAFLAVAKGSLESPRLIVLSHQGGASDQAPVVLVGKGITFDSGGISIKPAAAMDEMKYDMCGAATVFGVLQACAELELPLNVVGIVPACENMPSGNALKPGDIIKSMSGKHIEIQNTDAEGRLILCDALTYAQEQFKPKLIIDVATLTGACVMALGHVRSALYANRDELGNELLAAGEAVGDLAWRMPLDDEYQKMIDSSVADVSNLGERGAGSVTAACFLARFVDVPWAHLDIAGTASLSAGPEKGGTGRPVPLLVKFLSDFSRNLN